MVLQAQKSERQSIQKLRLLRLSLENRLEEFPTLAEGQDQNGDTPPLLPKPAQLTGQRRENIYTLSLLLKHTLLMHTHTQGPCI